MSTACCNLLPLSDQLNFMQQRNNSYFTRSLIDWHLTDNKRDMPWKGESDPYRIWISEIILQQTRVDQGMNYYLRFIKTFPTVAQLAKAPESRIFKLWEGLGYYSRCKNLMATARMISGKYGNKFPASYQQLLTLPGIGPYTAAAIASFAFSQPYAVVDGNVYRVLARFFEIETPIDGTEGKKQFSELAAQLLDKKEPGLYNQAIMDLGATICKPRLALCSGCPLHTRCMAFKKGTVDQLPVKGKKPAKRTRWLYYLVFRHNDQYLVRKRTGKDIWQNLYEYVLLERSAKFNIRQLKQMDYFPDQGVKKQLMIKHVSHEFAQQLTHQTISGRILDITARKRFNLPGYKWVPLSRIRQLPFPKLLAGHLESR